MDRLVVKIVEVLYLLKIVVDEFGKWIDIYNYVEIESCWDKIKNEILEYYEGEVVEKYIEYVECLFESLERLLILFCFDYFLRVFFNGIYVGYIVDYEFEKELLFLL